MDWMGRNHCLTWSSEAMLKQWKQSVIHDFNKRLKTSRTSSILRTITVSTLQNVTTKAVKFTSVKMFCMMFAKLQFSLFQIFISFSLLPKLFYRILSHLLIRRHYVILHLANCALTDAITYILIVNATTTVITIHHFPWIDFDEWIPKGWS